MKTTKLSKNFAALCLSVAAFCAAQGALAEVVVPEWQNSYSTSPANSNTQFYLYHIASEKFATNNVVFANDDKNATPWQQAKGDALATIVNGTKYYMRTPTTEQANFSFNKNKGVFGDTDAGRTFTFTKNDNNAWSLQFTSSIIFQTYTHQLQGNDGMFKVSYQDNTKTYEWYLISPAQYNNHISIADAKIVLDEANGLLETAIESETQQALQTAVENTENVIEAINNIEEDASVAINEQVVALNKALTDYKDANANQMYEVLGNTISAAQKFSPMFDFLATAIGEANAIYTKEDATPEEFDKANKALAGVVKKAQAIVESDEYAAYLGYIQQIRDNIAKAADAGYTGYDVTTHNNAIATAETVLLGVNSKVDFFKDKKDDPNKIGDNLRAAADNAAGDVARYAYAEAVVAQAAKIGYTAEVAPLKAASVADLPALIDGIRTSAMAGINDFVDNYESEDPIDMTIFIKNNSFELGNTNGWTVQNSGGDTGVKLADPDYLSNGIDGGFLFNAWEGGNLLTGYRDQGHPIYQTLNGLPNGKYRLEALLTSDSGNKTFLTINRTAVGEGVSSANGQGEFVEASYEFSVTNGTVTIGANGESFLTVYTTWFRADNFRLSLISLKTVELADDAETYAYEEGAIRRVKVNRTIQPGKWTTLCLPMAYAIPQYVKLYEVKEESLEGDHVSITVKASEDTQINAGKPYIVKYPASHKSFGITVNHDPITEFVASGVELAEKPQTVGDYVPFVGLFSATDLNAGDIYVSTSTDASAEVPVYKELSETASNKQMKGFRAYFKVPDGASSNVRFITDEVITNIMQAIEDQQVANGTYDLSGRKAATLQKGTYVIDGKKVIIK